MKLVVDRYTVEIKARYSYETRNSEDAVEAFLNGLSILASQAEKQFTSEGANALAKWAERVSSDMYEHLKEAGAYNR